MYGHIQLVAASQTARVFRAGADTALGQPERRKHVKINKGASRSSIQFRIHFTLTPINVSKWDLMYDQQPAPLQVVRGLSPRYSCKRM